MPYRNFPWQQMPSPDAQYRDAQERRDWEDALRLQQQLWTNQAQGIYNQMNTAQAMQGLAALGYNLAGDIPQQQLALGRMGLDMAQTRRGDQRQATLSREGLLSQIARERMSQAQQERNWQQELARLGYQRMTTEEPSIQRRALQAIGYVR